MLCIDFKDNLIVLIQLTCLQVFVIGEYNREVCWWVSVFFNNLTKSQNNK